jgi:SAM-dependent methyltransferase
VVLFGPLYHLTERADRIQAMCEAHRVLRPGGTLLAVAISRFASALDGLSRGYFKDPEFAEIVCQDLASGQHRNPTGRPEYFMDTFFHHPDELRTEVAEAGFGETTLFGVEGISWFAPDFESWWENPDYRDRLLLSRAIETEPSILGASAHIMAIATRQTASTDWR